MSDYSSLNLLVGFAVGYATKYLQENYIDVTSSVVDKYVEYKLHYFPVEIESCGSVSVSTHKVTVESKDDGIVKYDIEGNSYYMIDSDEFESNISVLSKSAITHDTLKFVFSDGLLNNQKELLRTELAKWAGPSQDFKFNSIENVTKQLVEMNESLSGLTTKIVVEDGSFNEWVFNLN